MRQKLKPKKCKFRLCRKEFAPSVEWQKFCCDAHRIGEQWRRHEDIVQKAQRIIDEKEKEAGA